jgi:hypothetical protein
MGIRKLAIVFAILIFSVSSSAQTVSLDHGFQMTDEIRATNTHEFLRRVNGERYRSIYPIPSGSSTGELLSEHDPQDLSFPVKEYTVREWEYVVLRFIDLFDTDWVTRLSAEPVKGVVAEIETRYLLKPRFAVRSGSWKVIIDPAKPKELLEVEVRFFAFEPF